MVADADLDVNQVHTTNFQAVSVWNDVSRDFGAVSNYLRIPNADVKRLAGLQTYRDGYTAVQKMGWLTDYRGRIYLYENRDDEWQTAPWIRWGTLVLGGNLVRIDKVARLSVHLPAMAAGEKITLPMGRLVCYTPDDFGATHQSHPHLVHRAWCAGENNIKIDSPKGVVYTPLWSPRHWIMEGPGKIQPKAFWIPMRWLER